MNIILISSLIIIVAIFLWALLTPERSRNGYSEKDDAPEKMYRRRAADAEIEEKFPDDRERSRRKTDISDELPEIEDDFALPFQVDEIIPEYSRFRIYRRTLLNGEIYAKKGDFNTATSLYEGVNARINDAETNEKIEANINYLNNYKKHQLAKQEQRARQEETFPSKKPSEIRFSMDGPFSIPDKIQIGLSSPPQPQLDVKKIAEEVAREIYQNNKDFPGRDNEEFSQLRSDVHGLQNRVTELNEEKRKTQQEIDELRKVHGSITETDREPQISRVKYEGQLPVTIDPGPILEILERIPNLQAPDPKRMKGPSDKPGTQTPEGKTVEDTRKETIEKKEVEDQSDDWELLSDYLKETDSTEQLTDEDIFEKILEEDSKQRGKRDEIEILGDQHDETDLEYSVTDGEQESKLREEEKFYEKFLQHNKRKKKELPILKVTYDFSKLPDEFSLSKEKNILEYSFYKFKPMLEKAEEYIKKRHVRDAINYYKVVMNQNIPPEFKSMIRKNTNDLIEYLEKYLTSD